jgi:hypothetical protein
VTLKNIEDEIVFNRLPPDSGVVTPIARPDDEVDAEAAAQLSVLEQRLPDWPPAHVPDPVQRVRNYLYVAAVPDVLQMPMERFTPAVVFQRLQADYPRDQLIKLLYWVAVHPFDGDDAAAGQLAGVGIDAGMPDPTEVRGRAGVYAVKLLGRLTGHLP